MFEFCIALTAFLVAHLIPASRSLRARLILLMGRTAYLVAYSILSLVLLGWLIVAAQRADTVWLWDPAPWQWHVPFIAMPMATFLLVAGLLSANPLSISLRGGTTPGPITAITRHPVLWAFLIWATAHIPPNGTGVALLLFGAMALFSLFGFILLDLKARKRLGPGTLAGSWRPKPPFFPSRRFSRGGHDGTCCALSILPALMAAALYVWFVLQGHALLIGPDPLAGLAAME